MGPPTVLHVISTLRSGGAEHMLASLVTASRNDNISPVVVDLRGDGELAAGIRAAGVPVHSLGFKHPAALPVVLWRLTALIRQLRPSAIQSWLYYADLMSLWALERSGRRQETRLYWGVRCSDMDQSQYRRGLRWAIAGCASRSGRPDAVVANSFAGREAHLRLGYAPRAFPVILNGIDSRRFRPDAALRASTRTKLGLPDDQPLVLHVARLDPMKDHESLLQVAAELPEIRFLAVGSGTEGLAGPPNFTALGPSSDLPALYAGADLALSTSAFGEGFPNVIGEAMAAGLPVVATNVGDSSRIVGDAGIIVPPRNVSGMVAAVRRLASESESERRQRAILSRKRIECNFSLDRVVATFDALHLRGTLPVEEVIPQHDNSAA